MSVYLKSNVYATNLQIFAELKRNIHVEFTPPHNSLEEVGKWINNIPFFVSNEAKKKGLEYLEGLDNSYSAHCLTNLGSIFNGLVLYT